MTVSDLQEEFPLIDNLFLSAKIYQPGDVFSKISKIRLNYFNNKEFTSFLLLQHKSLVVLVDKDFNCKFTDNENFFCIKVLGNIMNEWDEFNYPDRFENFYNQSVSYE
jgi:hypothetical protein